MHRFPFFILIFLFLSSCKPSLYEIRKLETSQEIKNGILLIQLKDERENIELLEKYGREKKAARLEKETEKYNFKIKSAFKEYYNYSDYHFILQKEWIDSINGKIRIVNANEGVQELDNENIFYAYFSSQKEYGDDDREFDTTTIRIKSLSQLMNSFKRELELTTHDVGGYPNFNHLAKFTEKKLIDWNRKRGKSLNGG